MFLSLSQARKMVMSATLQYAEFQQGNVRITAALEGTSVHRSIKEEAVKMPADDFWALTSELSLYASAI